MANAARCKVSRMSDDPAEKHILALATCELAIVQALATYASDSIRLGFRKEAVEGMARAIVILNEMEDGGRIDDSSLPVMAIADRLSADKIYDDVMSRARDIRKDI